VKHYGAPSRLRLGFFLLSESLSDRIEKARGKRMPPRAFGLTLLYFLTPPFHLTAHPKK
jgi:hypothetical protein